MPIEADVFDKRREPPSKPGWYPVIVCYDFESWLGASYWDGKDWFDGGYPSTMYYNKPCVSPDHAMKWDGQ